MTGLLVRMEEARDRAAIRELLCAAFEGRVEADLVDALRESAAYIPELSLVAEMAGRVVGHVLLTRAVVRGERGSVAALALAPMAVQPSLQRGGIGGELVKRALAEAQRLGHELVIVLGHPEYYPRFGFALASRWGIRCPFDAPNEAFMALWLGKERRAEGVVEYAEAFRNLE